MPTRKVGDLPEPCRHPEHSPPTHQVFEAGIWEHECPGCGKKTTFRVDTPLLGSYGVCGSCRQYGVGISANLCMDCRGMGL